MAMNKIERLSNKNDKNNIAKSVGLILGPLLAIIFVLMPEIPGLSTEGKKFLGLLCWIVVWWATGAVHYSVTSLIPIFGLPLFKIMKIRETASIEISDGTALYKSFSLASPELIEAGSKISISLPGSTVGLSEPTIIFFLGLLILSGSLVVTGLDRRIAYVIINLIGYSKKKLLLGLTISTGLISSFISNTSATAIHIPIAKALATQFDEKKDSNFSKALSLTSAYASTFAGGSTITGRASLLLMVGMLFNVTGIQITYLGWMKIALVYSWGMVILLYFYLQRIYKLDDSYEESVKEQMMKEKEDLGPMSRREKIALAYFCLAILLFMTETLWSKVPFFAYLEGYLTVQVIALLIPFLLFITPVSVRPLRFVITWKEISGHINWNVILVFSAGLTIASAVVNTGIANWVATALTHIQVNEVLFIIILVVAVSLLTELISNTASMTLVLSIILSLHQLFDVDIILLVTSIAMASEFAFMLPSGTPGNAMILDVGSVDIPTMIKVGFPLKVIAIVLWLIWSFVFIF